MVAEGGLEKKIRLSLAKNCLRKKKTEQNFFPPDSQTFAGGVKLVSFFSNKFFEFG